MSFPPTNVRNGSWIERLILGGEIVVLRWIVGVESHARTCIFGIAQGNEPAPPVEAGRRAGSHQSPGAEFLKSLSPFSSMNKQQNCDSESKEKLVATSASEFQKKILSTFSDVTTVTAKAVVRI